MAKKQAASLRELLTETYTKDLDSIEKELSISSTIVPIRRLSTGLLSMDLLTGGGLAPGMVSFFGSEGSAKSTMVMHAFGSALKKQLPINVYNDPENAMNPDYTGNIIRRKDFANIFGKRDPKKGDWLSKPEARYYDTGALETVFQYMHSQLNNMPDKMYSDSAKQWFYVFRNKKNEIAKMHALKLEHDKNLFSKTGRYWCPIEDIGTQALFIVDSYASLLAEDVDEEENEGNAIAIEPRLFAKYIKRVVSKVRRKGAILLGTNQLRKVPMAMYGPSETEPGGEALKFYSSARFRMAPRQVPSSGGWATQKGNKGICIEDSVEIEGGVDRYAFKNSRNIKNKWGIPYLETNLRVWMSDANGQPWGFDPVHDAANYLINLTGQAEARNSKGQRVIKFTGISKEDKHLKDLRGAEMTWTEFKTAILKKEKLVKDTDMVKKTLKGMKKLADVDIRGMCFKQAKTGRGQELLVKNRDNAVGEDMEA